MARLPALIDALTRADGRPRRTVDHVAREVREAGLIQTTKRGRGAAEMTPLDAAFLILGLYGAANPAEAAQAAERLAAYTNIFPGAVPADLTAIKAAPDLVHAIAALIELGPRIAPASNFTDLLMEIGSFSPAEAWPDGYSVHLTFTRPERGPKLRLVYPDADEEEGATETLFIYHGRERFPDEPSAVQTTTRVNGDLFRAVHAVLFART